jgi:hypothetical protein
MNKLFKPVYNRINAPDQYDIETPEMGSQAEIKDISYRNNSGEPLVEEIDWQVNKQPFDLAKNVTPEKAPRL